MSKRHEVRLGECIEAIAFQHGHHPRTVWEDGENAGLREKRKSMNVLEPGDVVMVPALRTKTEGGATGERHTFRRKGVPSRFRVRVVVNGKALADVPYRLEVEGEIVAEARTDDDGWVDRPVDPDAVEGLLVLRPGERDELVLGLRLGHLQPVETDKGLRARLFNLGYLREMDDDADQVLLALCWFQDASSLEVTGQADQTTRARLVEVHGG